MGNRDPRGLVSGTCSLKACLLDLEGEGGKEGGVAERAHGMLGVLASTNLVLRWKGEISRFVNDSGVSMLSCFPQQTV